MNLRDLLAPAGTNTGSRRVAFVPNNAVVAGSVAIMFCRATNGKVLGVRLDAEDLPRTLAAGRWRISNFNPRGDALLYCYTSIKHKTTYLHRFILNPAPGKQGDHTYHRTLDNRKSELREASRSANQLNRRFVNVGPDRCILKMAHGFKAIRWEGKKRISLGAFPTKEQAAECVRQYLLANGATYAAGAL